jgi:hypothetical protein
VAVTSTAASQYLTERASDALTTRLMADAADIIRRAEAEGREPDDELREAVSRTVLSGMVQGYSATEDATNDGQRERDEPEDGAKRRRTEGG